MNEESESKLEWWTRVIKNVGNWLAHKDKVKWLKDMRGLLCVVATVIATMTFQSAMNPPGGVWPPGGVRPPMPIAREKIKQSQCGQVVCPGQSVLAVVLEDEYELFLIWNTTCFVSSLAVCLLLVSGFPLNHRFFTWLLSIGMCITISSLTLTYLSVVDMTSPGDLWVENFFIFRIVLYIWISLLGLVAFVHSLRIFIWIVTLWIDRRNKKP
ncbi:uncharacterized protein LOC109802583 [Cajanus cajan]|uniref:PGG domain-containing protein n=1 Tax=Cajanus cajan TaxID=3821 RepID=A0A151T9E4_CAJCA|nr:uncharacterized protein LOC109802583 [Cajanus cajan]KYP63661.1 hypothetical protein KK1_018240 [Cajanus cajan]